jgi:hypothetical protein
MTANAALGKGSSSVPAANTGQVQPKGAGRFDWRGLFGILAIAIALVILAASVRLFAVGFAHSAQGHAGRNLCYTYLDVYRAGSRSGALGWSLAWPVLVVAGLGLGALGVLSTRRQGSIGVRRVSWAGLTCALTSALVYSAVFGLWLLGNLFCNYSNFLSPP